MGKHSQETIQNQIEILENFNLNLTNIIWSGKVIKSINDFLYKNLNLNEINEINIKFQEIINSKEYQNSLKNDIFSDEQKFQFLQLKEFNLKKQLILEFWNSLLW